MDNNQELFEEAYEMKNAKHTMRRFLGTMMKQKIRRRKRRKTHLCLLRVILQEMRPVLLRPM